MRLKLGHTTQSFKSPPPPQATGTFAACLSTRLADLRIEAKRNPSAMQLASLYTKSLLSAISCSGDSPLTAQPCHPGATVLPDRRQKSGSIIDSMECSFE